MMSGVYKIFSVGFPRTQHRLSGIMKEVNIMGETRGIQQFVQRGTASHISFAMSHTLRG